MNVNPIISTLSGLPEADAPPLHLTLCVTPSI